MKSGPGNPKVPSWNTNAQEMIDAAEARYGPKPAPTRADTHTYTVEKGSTASSASDPKRRIEMLRARIADTERLIATAPQGERKNIHERMLPIYRKELANLEQTAAQTTAQQEPETVVTPDHSSKESVVDPVTSSSTTASEATATESSTKETRRDEGGTAEKSTDTSTQGKQSPVVTAEEESKPAPEQTGIPGFKIAKEYYNERAPELRKIPRVSVEKSSTTSERTKSLQNDLARIRAELDVLNAGFGNREIETARKFGVDTFNRMEASDAIQRFVALREAEVKRLEQAIGRVESDARIRAIRAQLDELERAYHGNDAISVARRFGVDTFNQAEARDAIERMVAQREAEIHALEGVSVPPKKKQQQTQGEKPTTSSSESSTKDTEKDTSGTAEKSTDTSTQENQSSADSTESNTESTKENQETASSQSKEAQTEAQNTESSEAIPNNKALVPIPQEQKKAGSIDPWVERYLSEQFNIKREDLASIEGLGLLSVAQQKFICENLTQLTLGSVQEEAARLVSRSVGLRKSEMEKNYGKFLGGVLASAREYMTKGYTKLKTEKEVAALKRWGGIKEHGELLNSLVQNIVSYGPRIHEKPNGELFVDLLNIRERARSKSIRDAEYFAMNELNAVAHELAQTPAEWRGQTLGVEVGGESKITRFFKENVLRTKGTVQEGAYQKRTEAYEKSKRTMEGLMRARGLTDTQIASMFIGLDAQVFQLQTLRTNPNAMEELANIKDKDFFKESAKAFFSGPGAYMALGTIGRTLGGAALGFFGAPLAAGTMGAFRSWNRSAAELRERDRNARAGVRDGKAGALDVVSAEQIVNVAGKPVQNGLTAKLERLRERTQSETDPVKKKKLLALLYERVEYMHDRQRLQKIDYGPLEGRVTRQVAFTEALSQTLAYLAEEKLAEDVTSRIRQFGKGKDRQMTGVARIKASLNRAEQAIIDARLKGRRSDLVRSAGVAASFSIAGALFADLFRGDSVVLGDGNATQGAGVRAPDGVSPGSGVPTEDAAHAASAATLESAPAPYTVQRGDTLWDILSQKTSLSELGATRARENAVANIVKSLSPAQLQDIGVTSGDVRLIHPGDTINMEKLSQILKSHQDIITSAKERFGTLPIDTDPANIIPKKPTP